MAAAVMSQEVQKWPGSTNAGGSQLPPLDGYTMSRTLENTIVRLLRERPFYGHLLVGLRKGVGGDAPLGITLRQGIPTLTVNDGLLASYPPGERGALLEHCVLHLLHLHPSRRKERSRHDWDLACDLAVNDLVEGMPAAAPRAVYLSLPEGLAAEEYYRLLVDPFDTGSIAGSGSGSASREERGKSGKGHGDAAAEESAAPLGDAMPLDDHTVWEESDSTPLRLAEEMVRGMVRHAWQRCDGVVPGEVRPLVEGLLAPSPTPWRMVLRQFVATAGRIGRRSTWMRESRRFGHATPGSRKRRRLCLLVGVDVSDSTDASELREAFAAELLRIARGRDASLTILYANSRIQKIETMKGHAATVESYHGGGFTDLRPVFDHARTMHPRPAAVIYLTDGIGPAPERMEFPTLWVLTREGERPAPWGVELRLEV